jgi:hypothetical protein
MKFYTLLDDFEDVGILGCWANHTGSFDNVIGYTVLGAIILRSSSANEYLVLHPRANGNNAKNYGKFESLNEFENIVLSGDGFTEYCISPFNATDIDVLIEENGPLGKNEAFYPAPDPAIGGSGELATYKKGNVWVSADISGQNRGL